MRSYYIATFQFLRFQVNCCVFLVVAVIKSKSEFDVGEGGGGSSVVVFLFYLAFDVVYCRVTDVVGDVACFFMLLIDCCIIF